MFGYFIIGYPLSFSTFLSLRHSLQHFTFFFDIFPNTKKTNFQPITITGQVICLKMLDIALAVATCHYTGCPTRYRTGHFFNNSNTNEDIATKFEQEYVRCRHVSYTMR